MGKETIYRCDMRGCKATRPFVSPTNHWFIVGKPTEQSDTIEGRGIVVMPFPTEDRDSDIHCLPEDDKMFCGEAHVLEYIAQQLQDFYSVAPATTGVGNSSTESQAVLDILHDVGTEHPFEQVPFSDHAAVERDQKDAFCMDVEDPYE
jgi:hypothetical protein